MHAHAAKRVQYVPQRGHKISTYYQRYYQGWFMYMRYTQGQNEEYLLSRSIRILNQVLTI